MKILGRLYLWFMVVAVFLPFIGILFGLVVIQVACKRVWYWFEYERFYRKVYHRVVGTQIPPYDFRVFEGEEWPVTKVIIKLGDKLEDHLGRF